MQSDWIAYEELIALLIYSLVRGKKEYIYIYKFCVDTSISFSFQSILIYFHTLVFFSKLKILVESIEDLLTIKVNKR